MCGPSSALGLEAAERDLWPYLRERLRQPGHSMAMMRGVLGGDVEVAAIAEVDSTGLVTPVALLVTPVMAEELTLGPVDPDEADVRHATIGEDAVEVLVRMDADNPTPIAIRVNPWIRQHLTLFARRLWSRR